MRLFQFAQINTVYNSHTHTELCVYSYVFVTNYTQMILAELITMKRDQMLCKNQTAQRKL